MAKTIASLSDGRVCPWYSDDPVPAGWVEVPDPLLAKFANGNIADGVALAKTALAGEAKAPAASKAATPPPAEPAFPSVNTIPATGMMRA